MSTYRDLSQYLTTRIAAIGETPSSLTERLGWGAAYLSNIINGQFRPSRRRCVELAEQFSDDPNIILALAGFYVPRPPSQTTRVISTTIAPGVVKARVVIPGPPVKITYTAQSWGSSKR